MPKLINAVCGGTQVNPSNAVFYAMKYIVCFKLSSLGCNQAGSHLPVKSRITWFMM